MCVDAVDAGNRAHEARFEERGPFVHQTSVAAHVILQIPTQTMSMLNNKMTLVVFLQAEEHTFCPFDGIVLPILKLD